MASSTGTTSTLLCSDGRRALVATVPAVVVPVATGFVIGLVRPSVADDVATTVVLTLAGWNLFAFAYVGLTLHTFRPVERDAFVARMTARGPTHRTRVVRRLRGDGPTFSIEAAVVAFGLVLVVPHIEAIQIDDWLLVPLTITTLLGSWALSVVSYALHYAEQDLLEPSLEFPGDRTNAFADYLYFSIAVATTFGATDVNITKPQMRRVVNLHTILTFVYNSVIVALLASLLIR